jgi:hypothetical protein
MGRTTRASTLRHRATRETTCAPKGRQLGVVVAVRLVSRGIRAIPNCKMPRGTPVFARPLLPQFVMRESPSIWNTSGSRGYSAAPLGDRATSVVRHDEVGIVASVLRRCNVSRREPDDIVGETRTQKLERANLMMRMSMRSFTRPTNGFLKDDRARAEHAPRLRHYLRSGSRRREPPSTPHVLDHRDQAGRGAPDDAGMSRSV